MEQRPKGVESSQVGPTRQERGMDRQVEAVAAILHSNVRASRLTRTQIVIT